MMSDEIKVICKKCGRTSKASEFVLDPDYKMMVCLQCSKERKSSFGKKPSQQQPEATQQKKEAPAVSRPRGWDSDDEALEKMSKRTSASYDGEPKVKYEVIDDDNIKLTCPKCDYKFTYNTFKMSPSSCPYCSVKLSIRVR